MPRPSRLTVHSAQEGVLESGQWQSSLDLSLPTKQVSAFKEWIKLASGHAREEVSTRRVMRAYRKLGPDAKAAADLTLKHFKYDKLNHG